MTEQKEKKRMPAFEILKALPHHADELKPVGVAFMVAICCRWDDFRCQRAVCWPNKVIAEKCGISRNTVNAVRARLVDAGWLLYEQEGRYAGHYTPKLPSWHAQISASDCASTVHRVVQTLCIDRASTVHPEATYTPSPNPDPIPNPEQHDQRTNETPEAPPPRRPTRRIPQHLQELKDKGAKVTKSSENHEDWNDLVANKGLDQVERALRGLSMMEQEAWPNVVEDWIREHPRLRFAL